MKFKDQIAATQQLHEPLTIVRWNHPNHTGPLYSILLTESQAAHHAFRLNLAGFPALTIPASPEHLNLARRQRAHSIAVNKLAYTDRLINWAQDHSPTSTFPSSTFPDDDEDQPSSHDCKATPTSTPSPSPEDSGDL